MTASLALEEPEHLCMWCELGCHDFCLASDPIDCACCGYEMEVDSLIPRQS